MNSNLNILYDYICHILFRFDLIHKPNLIDKEAYFIPSGYDDLSSLKTNYSDEEYEKKITPLVRPSKIEEDIQCEDTNIFFESLKDLGVKGKDKFMAKNRISAPFVELKKNSVVDLKNYETNIIGGRGSIMNLDEKEKKYEDKRKAIKAQISNNPLNSNKEIQSKNVEDEAEKKKKIREAMLAKIGKGKNKKP